MEPGSPALGHWADPRAGCPKGTGGLLAMAPLHPLVAVLAAADRNREARRHRTHLSQVDLELLGQGLELELAAAVRAARREGCFELPVDRPGRCHAMAVATVGLAATPARLCRFLLRVAFGERGGLALSRTAGLGEQPLQLCDARFTLGKARLTLGQAVVQLPELGGVGLEKPAKLSDLSDQLLVGVGFSARRSDARRNSQRYARRLCSWWMPLNKYETTNTPAQRVKTLVHELAHALLHESYDDRALAELEAESTAYVVCQVLGIDSGDYSFGYVATWAGDGDQAVAGIKAYRRF